MKMVFYLLMQAYRPTPRLLQAMLTHLMEEIRVTPLTHLPVLLEKMFWPILTRNINTIQKVEIPFGAPMPMFPNEYDYFSVGFGGSLAQLFNEKNTEISVAGNVYLDKWNPQYPVELRDGFAGSVIGYDPSFSDFNELGRRSYSASFSFSQILSKKMQASVFFDVVRQNGLLSTPFQRVYFGDVDDFFVEDFQLADDVERLPDTRLKFPLGARLNYYLNDIAILRSYYRYYFDDWGIRSHTINLEVPLKVTDKFTAYPTYRFYTQTTADYFFPKEEALSEFEFYTSDFDLSAYNANQYGLGLQYKDVLNSARVLFLGLKTIDLRYSYYHRNNGLDASIITLSTSFIVD